MNALDQLSVLGLILAAVLLLMACVKTDRVRAWRARFNPRGEELPDSAFITTRILFVLMAGLMIYMAIDGFAVSSRQS